MDAQRTVLIVDKSEGDRALYREFLQHESRCTYQFTESASGAEALKLGCKVMPDSIRIND